MDFLLIALIITSCLYGFLRLVVALFEMNKNESYLSILVIIYSLSIIIFLI